MATKQAKKTNAAASKDRRVGRPRSPIAADEFRAAIAARVHSARTACGLSSHELATRAKLGLGTIIRIERGESASAETILAVANALEMSAAALMAGVPKWIRVPPARESAKRK